MRDGEEGEGCLRSQFREWNRFWAERVGGEKKKKRRKQTEQNTAEEMQIRWSGTYFKPVSAQMASVYIHI